MKKSIETLKLLEVVAHLLRKGISRVIGALENDEENLNGKKMTAPLMPPRMRARTAAQWTLTS